MKKRAELSCTDGGEEQEHFCELCSTGFDTIPELLKHECDGREEAELVTDGGTDQKYCRACGWVDPDRGYHLEYGTKDVCPDCGPFGPGLFDSKAALVDYDHESAHYVRDALVTDGGRSIFAIDVPAETLSPETRLIVEETNVVLVARDVHPLYRQATMWALGDSSAFPEQWALEHTPGSVFEPASQLATDGGRDLCDWPYCPEPAVESGVQETAVAELPRDYCEEHAEVGF